MLQGLLLNERDLYGVVAMAESRYQRQIRRESAVIIPWRADQGLTAPVVYFWNLKLSIQLELIETIDRPCRS